MDPLASKKNLQFEMNALQCKLVDYIDKKNK
jgi:hypothetical protein